MGENLYVLKGQEVVMGKIEGISIRNYGSLKDITLGKTLSHQKEKPLSNMTTIIGPSGNGKSTIADVFGFIADCLEMGIEAACDAGNRGGFEQIRSQGIEDAIRFELYFQLTAQKQKEPLMQRLQKIISSYSIRSVLLFFLWILFQ